MGTCHNKGSRTYVTKGRNDNKQQSSQSEKQIKIRSDNLPELTGSEKQVAWANSIRENYIKDINERLTVGDIDGQDLYDAYYRGTGVQRGRLKDGDGNIYRSQYSLKEEEIRKNNPNLSPREIREKAEDYLYDITEQANSKGRAARQAARASGATKEEIKAAGKKAEASVFVPIYSRWVKNDLKTSTRNAGVWIDTFKNTKYSAK